MRVEKHERKPLREPSRGWVQWPACVDLAEARREIVAASLRAAERTGYEPNEPSPLEVWLLAAFFYYDLTQVLPQTVVGPYVCDFYFATNDGYDLDVEVDGREWHTDGLKDVARDAYMRRNYVGVRRFPGSEVFRDPLWCARHVAATLGDISRGIRYAA